VDPKDLSDDITRRSMLKRAGLGASVLALPGILSACGDDDEEGAASSGKSSDSSAKAVEGESPELTKLLDSITSKSVVVATYGGTTEAARKAAFWDSFTQRTGVKVITPEITGTLGDDQLNGKVKPRWDSFHASSYQVLFSQKHGTKPLVEVPMTEDLAPDYARDYMWQSFLVGYVAASLKGAFDTAPATPADFFDLKKFPGKRAWATNYYVDATKEWALIADGVTPDELYPLDLERADAKIESIWDDLVFYEAYPQIPTFLTSKTVSMAWGPSGIFAALPAKGVQVDIIWENLITSWNNEAIIPDAKNMDAVLALSAWCTDPARQAKFCTATHYGPPSQGAFDKMADDIKTELPNSPGRNPTHIDDQYYRDNYDAMYEDNQKLFKRH
jgi:putative spermidine/putrescine transport system substrate-binding protein